MSAMNVFVTDAVHVFTDGGHYSLDDMKLRAIGNKIAFLPHLNAVIASTGYAHATTLISNFLIDKPFATFDDLADGFGDYLKWCMAHCASIGVPRDWAQLEVLLAGWSEADAKPKAFVVRDHRKGNEPPFQTVEYSRYVSPEHPRFASIYAGDVDDVATAGLDLMRAQREIRFGVEGAKSNVVGHQVVAGFCQHTVVDRDGIHSRILERWPDRFEPLPA